MDRLQSFYHPPSRKLFLSRLNQSARTSASNTETRRTSSVFRLASGEFRLTFSRAFQKLSFLSSSQASTFNCDLSDLDQSELKLDVHYTHTPNRDYWLFAWNPFDYTCRDKITSISSGNNRVNSDRRMDIFRDSGKLFNRTSVISSSASSPISHNFNVSQTKLPSSSSSKAQ